MIRVFKRYFSIRNSVYFLFENAFILIFLLWGTAIGSFNSGVAWPYMIAVVAIAQFALYCGDLRLPAPRFSFREFLKEHSRAILWWALFLFLMYLVIPSSVIAWRPFWLKLVLFPFLLIGLRLGYQLLVTLHRWDTTILIIGSAPVAGLLKNILFYDKSLGFRALHFRWDITSPDTLAEEWARLSTIVAEHKIKKVAVALHERRGQLPVESLLNLRVQGVEVVDAASFYEEISGKILIHAVRPSSLIFGEGFSRLDFALILKRGLDIFLSFLGLVLSVPFFIILSLLIKLDSRGPVFYRQERVGEKGKPFMLIKFRSMRHNAELKSGPVWARKDDPRSTRIGRLMRPLRFDEIPQLVNVFKGEMSFVGPRPERAVFVDQLRKKIPYYSLRFSVRPGVTGWAQVKYRYGATEKDALEKLQYDLYYIKHLSLFLDITIIFETIKVVLAGKGVH